MMKITQAFVRDVKRHLKKEWHDQTRPGYSYGKSAARMR